MLLAEGTEADSILILVHFHFGSSKICTKWMKCGIALLCSAATSTCLAFLKLTEKCVQHVLSHHCMQPPPRSPHMPHLSDCRCLDSFATIGSIFLTSLISTSGIHIAHATCAHFPVVVFLNNPPVRGHNSHSTCCILLKQAL